MKKIFALVLTLSMLLCCNTVIYAVEDTSTAIPADATKHTIEVSLEPGEDWDATVAPRIWGDPSASLIDHHSVYTSSFYVSDRYFAYEMEALPGSGVPTDQGYTVALQYTSGGTIASATGCADGSIYKVDWIDIYVDSNYRFHITNSTDYGITVYITYYSWN